MTVATMTILIQTLAELLRKLLFAIGGGLCRVVGFLTDVFAAVSDPGAVTYGANGLPEERLVLKALFGSANINAIFWGMALIGIVTCLGFTALALIKTRPHSGDGAAPTGSSLNACLKGVTLILLINLIISPAVSLIMSLTDAVNYRVVNSQGLNRGYDVTFDSEDYAAMVRGLNTIGNYSLNDSYNSRYNLNSCYNDIRGELKLLADKGKFDVTYVSTAYDENGKARQVNTWQSVLQSIYRSVDDINVPQPVDEYNTKLSEALLAAMDVIRNDTDFKALEGYHVSNAGAHVGETAALDRMIMLLGTMYGSGSSIRAVGSITDYLRAPYYYGQKDIFNYSECSRDFDMSLGAWLYIIVIAAAFFFVKELLLIGFNAGKCIFNILTLYITEPPFIASAPLDGRECLSRWIRTFTVQSAGLFGTVVTLRLLMIFLPVLFSGDFQFLEAARIDFFAKIAIGGGALFTARKASGMIVGVLSEAADPQAEDESTEAIATVDMGFGLLRPFGGIVFTPPAGFEGFVMFGGKRFRKAATPIIIWARRGGFVRTQRRRQPHRQRYTRR